MNVEQQQAIFVAYLCDFAINLLEDHLVFIYTR